MVHSIVVTTELSALRLDTLLANSMEGLSRNAAQHLLENGLVSCNGLLLSKKSYVQKGSTIIVTVPEVKDVSIEAQDIPLDIIFEDDDVIVVNKPSGLVVHPAPGHPDGTLVNALLSHCGDSLSGIGGEKRPGIVHRIDKDTSGLIIAAKNDFAHQALSAQLSDHTLARTYECLVVGGVKDDFGTIDAPIGRHPAERKKMSVVRSGGRDAITHWEVISRYAVYTHLRCRLETGRTHQIRVHLSYMNHPILGDTVYGNKKPVSGLTGQCLHATALQFIHPRTNQLISLECPLPDEFTAMLEKLRRMEKLG